MQLPKNEAEAKLDILQQFLTPEFLEWFESSAERKFV